MNSLTLNAYAKINLSLDITGTRNDGYHLLRTVMQSVDICDKVTVALNNSNEIKLSCDNPSVPSDNKNTAFKAAKKFLEYTSLNSGADILIEKHIPSQAGMGGASADAAAVIAALNILTGVKLKLNELLNIAVTVGADVPFCLIGKTALCEGIGEKITPLEKLPDCFLVIAKPETGISTKDAYAQFDKIGTATKLFTDKMLYALKNENIEEIAESLGNVFEELSACKEPEIIKAEMIKHGALGACMTGSGSAVFGIFKDELKAEKCAGLLKEKYTFSCLSKPI